MKTTEVENPLESLKQGLQLRKKQIKNLETRISAMEMIMRIGNVDEDKAFQIINHNPSMWVSELQKTIETGKKFNNLKTALVIFANRIDE